MTTKMVSRSSLRRYWRLRVSLKLAIAVIPAGALLATGCSSAGSSSSSPASNGTMAAKKIPAPQVDQAARAELPSAVKASGTLVVGTSADYAPMEFVAANGHTIEGVDADLATAIAQALGLKVQLENATFDGLIPGLQAHRYNIVMAGMTDYKAREKAVNFVDYFRAGTSFYERASGGPAVTGLSSLCGDTVAVESGTSEQTDANTQKAACAKAHKPTLTVLVYNDQNAANLALASGRAQVGMADSPVAGYIVKQSHGTFKIVGQSYGTAPDGIAMAKNEPLAAALVTAVKFLQAKGIYAKILAKWGVQAGAVTTPRANGATS